MAVPTESFDTFIDRLLAVGCPGGRFTHQVSEDEITKLCSAAGAVFQAQPSLIEVEPPVVVCGDIHGQYSDLMRIFDKNELPPASNYLFLGDYIDRGRQNLETICLMFCFKVKYPLNFIMLRGNHECPAINRVYGFYEECNRRYKSMRLWQVFQDAFNWMPLVGLIGGRILCMHGGISPQIQNIDQLRQLHRPQDPPNPSIGIDLLWSDPDMWVKGWQANTRGVSYIFGQDCVIDMCAKLDIDLIARAHQVVQDGYEFFANKKLVTIFSGKRRSPLLWPVRQQRGDDVRDRGYGVHVRNLPSIAEPACTELSTFTLHPCTPSFCAFVHPPFLSHTHIHPPRSSNPLNHRHIGVPAPSLIQILMPSHSPGNNQK
ncbi:hypothetical protein WR25_13069 [Diploscapter pachys]|uniref:Serine/threonine-protein phosphatase n=1 Tax=Diploscapter pachys TaxID=2018661 RepID=A0A2A2J2I2_9BILA|nr:hypothetical protein WR25_13069 [Diploscapter pachys]